MARRKKSGAGGGIGAVVVGLLVVLAAIPREVWIGVGVFAAIGVGIYLYLKSKGGAHEVPQEAARPARTDPLSERDRKSTLLNSSHLVISYAVFCLKKKKA